MCYYKIKLFQNKRNIDINETMLNMKYYIIFILFNIFAAINAMGDAFELTVIHVNDIHSKIEQTNKYCGACLKKDAGKN